MIRQILSLSLLIGATLAAKAEEQQQETAAAASENSDLQARSGELDAAAAGYITAYPVGDVYGHGHGGHNDGYKHGSPVVYIPGTNGYKDTGSHGHSSYGHGHGGHGGGHGHGGYGHGHGKYHGPLAHTPHTQTVGSSGSYHGSHGSGGHGGYGGHSVHGHVTYANAHYDFSCYGLKPAFYGDAGHDCKVFHVCQKDGRQDTFKCPKWTRFNNYLGVCDWHFKVDKGCNPIKSHYH